jgi:glycosyltransferase involved in cell wall biosynthesis
VNPAATTEATDALSQRLATVLDVLDPRSTPASAEEASPAGLLLGAAEVLRRNPAPRGCWLVVVGLAGAMPDQALVRSVARAAALKEPEDFVIWLLDSVAKLATSCGNAEATLRVVQDRPLIDVNVTAKSSLLTGIQRVVRNVVSEWNDRHDVEFVVWTARNGAYRGLHPAERGRLLGHEVAENDATAQTAAGIAPEIVVPWEVPMVLTEVPTKLPAERLAALAELTGASLRLVGYDCIPVSSSESVPMAEPEKFGRYLEVVKFADRLAAISGTAAAEFEGFTRALGAQGLSGPRVTACPLPHTAQVSGADLDDEPVERPVVVCVGTVGRRKNQVALIEAAEVLWREGLDFEVRVFGRQSSERSPLTDLVPELQGLGRKLVVEPAVTDARIAGTLSHARCLVFPSLHEGFGLPIVEALSHGVPVVTSDHGSMSEVAETKGSLLVNPEDIEALTSALRALLTDDALHARLVTEARGRTTRTWTDYADDLWQVLVA